MPLGFANKKRVYIVINLLRPKQTIGAIMALSYPLLVGGLIAVVWWKEFREERHRIKRNKSLKKFEKVLDI